MPILPPPSPFRFIYQDESGDVARSHRNFIVGVLLVRDPEPLRNAVAQARAEFHYENELHFVKMSALRARVYRAVFKQLANVTGEFQFQAILVRRELLELRWFGGQRHLAYNFFTKLLLQRHADGIHQARMIADAKSRLREDFFLAYLPSELNLTAGRFVLQEVEPTDSKDDDVLQVTDLLTGCANVLASGLESGRKRAVCDDALRLGILSRDSLWDWRP